MKLPQYCSVCKTEYEMSVVPTDDDDGVIWLQCPVCKGYLPKVRASLPQEILDTLSGGAAASAVEPEASPEPVVDEPVSEPAVADLDVVEIEPEIGADVPSDDGEPEKPAEPEEPAEDPDEGLELLEGMDVSTAVPYRPWNVYEVGDVIHHLAWDDHGIVLEKESLPGGRLVVKTRFVEAGIVRLIEDDGNAPG